MIAASSGLVEAARDPVAAQRLAGRVVPLHPWQQPQSPHFKQELALPPTQTELPWRVQLAAHPLLQLGTVDVVQAGLFVGLRAIEGVRKRGVPVGPVLCCHAHSLIHIPVESDTAYRWHSPQTVCRSDMWECALDKHVATRSRCSGIWLLPPGPHTFTNSSELLHWLALTRSTAVHKGRASYGG